jgi:RimJ/RimL family protein N-acetyltransferase
MVSTERLVLRRFREEDAGALAAYRNDPEVARYQSWSVPYSPERAHYSVRSMAAADPGQPGWFQFAVTLERDGALIGDVGVNLDGNLRQAEIGYTIAPAFQRQGYGAEAVRAVLRYLFEERGLHRVSAECDARNEASARLLERVGFTREGLRRQHAWFKNEWADELLFGLLRAEWRG